MSLGPLCCIDLLEAAGELRRTGHAQRPAPPPLLLHEALIWAHSTPAASGAATTLMHLRVQGAPIGAHSDMEEDKELREFLCGGIFSDVTGELNELAQGSSWLPCVPALA